MTEEEKKAAKRRSQKKYREANKDKIAEYWKQYKQTPIGRANYLVQGYKQSDKKYNRGKCTLTAKWILENIFTKKCVYCGESDWRKLGCNRLDNSKPHTPDNVEPCCLEHNLELEGVEIAKKMSKKVYQYTLDGELVNVWESTAECGRNGYDQGNVCKCCNGRVKTYKGYKWQYAT